MTDRRRLCGSEDETVRRRCLLRQVAFAIEAGVDVVQIRERDLDAAPLAQLVAEAVGISRGTSTRIVVNDRADVAIACGAAGVHLRGDSIPVAAARAIAPPGFIVGRSVHSAWDALRSAAGADYLVAGTVWPTPSKPEGHPVIGIKGLADIVHAVPIPVLAIGGVTAARTAEVAAAGAAGVAAIGLFVAPARSADGDSCRATPLRAVTADVRTSFDTHKPPS